MKNLNTTGYNKTLLDWALLAIRIFVGLLFIFSGLIKANDPHGLSYKMQEFFEVWNMHFLNDYALFFSIAMNSFEVLAGVAIIIGVVIVSYIALISEKFTWHNFWLATSVLGPAVVMGLVGLWDDIKNLNPLPRFIGQSAAGLGVAFILILNDNIGNPTGITVLDGAITVIWIVGICNSINFFDNLIFASGAISIGSTAPINTA